MDKALQPICTTPKLEPALELHSRAAPSVEAHHRVNNPDTARNSGGRRIKRNNNNNNHKIKKERSLMSMKSYISVRSITGKIELTSSIKYLKKNILTNLVTQ